MFRYVPTQSTPFFSGCVSHKLSLNKVNSEAAIVVRRWQRREIHGLVKIDLTEPPCSFILFIGRVCVCVEHVVAFSRGGNCYHIKKQEIRESLHSAVQPRTSKSDSFLWDTLAALFSPHFCLETLLTGRWKYKNHNSKKIDISLCSIEN